VRKLKVRTLIGYERTELYGLEEGKYRIPFDDDETICLLEGQVINSYEELLQLANQELYKEKETLEITLFPVIAGG